MITINIIDDDWYYAQICCDLITVMCCCHDQFLSYIVQFIIIKAMITLVL